MRISVFGLGYVGSVSLGCLAQQGHDVIGVDINSWKVEMIVGGRSPIKERGLEALIAEGAEKGRIRATTSAADAVAGSDLSLVCVGTPGDAEGRLDLTFVTRVCREIGHALAAKDGYHVVVLHSTLLPGSTENTVIPVLEEAANGRAGQDFGVVYYPEFLREGTALRDFYGPPFKVIGRHDARAVETVIKMYEGVKGPLRILPLKSAEMLKYACNAFHALKVTFANEIGNICKSHGIDSHELMDVFCLDDELNLSSYYLKPGFAFGGSCLPKDLRALIQRGHGFGLDLPVLESVLPSNDSQIRIAADMVESTGRKKVGMLGLSFKTGTDDLRESPLVRLLKKLMEMGCHVSVYDPHVDVSLLCGVNKSSLGCEIPYFESVLSDSVDEVVRFGEVVIVGTKAVDCTEALARTRADQVIIDLVRAVEHPAELSAEYHGICW